MTAQEILGGRLVAFISQNPHCSVSVEGEHLLVQEPWGSDDARFKIPLTDIGIIDELNHVRFNPRFDAIFHDDSGIVEFLYGFLNPEDENIKAIIDRRFVAHFEGNAIECFFAEPTKRVFRFSKYFERLPSDTPNRSAQQLTPFRDVQKLDSLNDAIKKYFVGKIPRNFFIKSGEFSRNGRLDILARHINFLLSYYDRRSPTVVIHDADSTIELTTCKPIRHIEGEFPKELVIQPIDEIILKLIEVARSSQPRFAFLYFYQVIEYAGYYYVDEGTKKALRNHLKDPALISCGEEKIEDLFSIFSEINYSDDVKMRKVIEEHCDPSVIWKEIENDKEFFCTEHSFLGGFELKPLVSRDTTKAAWETMWMPKLFDQLTKIRNAIVHARERRENKVILPTMPNNKVLSHYIPVIQRVAEQIALKT